MYDTNCLYHLTGIFTGSIYNDKNLLNGEFPGEGSISHDVIVIKTHRYDGVMNDGEKPTG